MKNRTDNPASVSSRGKRFLGAILTLALMVPAAAMAQPFSNPATVNLQTAANFRVLAGTTITIGASNTVTGDAGVSPGNTFTNNGVFSGTTHLDNTTAIQAKLDLASAITDAEGRTADSTVATELGSTTLGRGVYDSGAGEFQITGTLTLSGTASDVFIFKMASTLTTFVSSSVVFTGGAQWTNVFWLVGSSATIDGDFRGNILASASITQNTDTLEGRALARDAFVTVNGTSVLPVQLVAFAATANRLNADLRWSTATELNNYGFEIERRQTGQWEKVGFVTGVGTSSSPRDYSYTDNNLSPGRYAYRMKQVDMNGAFSYYGSAEVEIGLTAKKFELESNYPNPFNPTTTIQFTLADDGLASLRVYNMLGQTVMTLFDGIAEAGKLYQMTFDASRLPSGLYFARLESGRQQMMQTMVLMK